MSHLVFAPAIQRHVAVPDCEVTAPTVAAALEQVFSAKPQLRGYLLDDQGHLRRHIAVFVDGLAIRDRLHLSDSIDAATDIYVVQALSGG
ncbi:MoaD/ThiS family protein [Pseudomonas cavernae]|uniref:MoaD/ThiS family protein n=1 Tax=Pseudomonas cavernae TaxID=2320867 RepID=A0A385Z0Q8_9PSED|nr:MoaD/ThiS family protein [Pseudomonas cavernae]AYC32264.1 MoaD/ThiS family protein [Pseudomonas cavernae]